MNTLTRKTNTAEVSAGQRLMYLDATGSHRELFWASFMTMSKMNTRMSNNLRPLSSSVIKGTGVVLTLFLFVSGDGLPRKEDMLVIQCLEDRLIFFAVLIPVDLPTSERLSSLADMDCQMNNSTPLLLSVYSRRPLEPWKSGGEWSRYRRGETKRKDRITVLHHTN